MKTDVNVIHHDITKPKPRNQLFSRKIHSSSFRRFGVC